MPLFESNASKYHLKHTGKLSIALLLILLLQGFYSVGSALALETEDIMPEAIFPEVFSGSDVRISHFREQLTLIFFWSSLCKECKRGLWYLAQLHKTYQPENFAALAISVDENIADVFDTLDHKPLIYQVLHDRKNYSTDLFELKTIPSLVLVDQSGRIRFQQAGYNQHHEEKISLAIQKGLNIDTQINMWIDHQTWAGTHLKSLYQEKNQLIEHEKQFQEANSTSAPLEILE